MIYFDPSEYVRGLQQILVSDKKRIGFLCGAGTSLAKKDSNTVTVPAVGQMTKIVIKKLKLVPEFDKAINEIFEEIGSDKFNIESFLSNVETKYSIIGCGTLNGLDKDKLGQLIQQTKENICEIVSVHKNINQENKMHMVHTDFAQWIGRADRKFPVEVFTTNYDYLFELGMEDNEVAYYDGFSGSFSPFFCAESVENLSYLPQQAKLWKVHGSLGWAIDEQYNRVVRGYENKDQLLIYPSILKYANSKKQPYTALMDRLTNFLKQPDAVLFVCGYSFSDEHINERIISALQTDTTAHVYALLYDKYKDDKSGTDYLLTCDSPLTQLAKKNSKLSIFGCRNAVIGCQYGEWKLKREPSKEDTIDINYYYDEDGPEIPDAPLNSEINTQNTWTGKGELVLPDFAKVVFFLQSMIINSTK